MFYYASKVFSALIWPSNVVVMLLVAGALLVVTRRSLRWGRRLLATGLSALVVLAYAPVGNWLVLPLEQRFARADLPARIDGIIMLGGFESASIGHARGQLTLNEGGERLTEALRLAVARPEAKVIFTGGVASIVREQRSAASTVARYLAEVGIAEDRIVVEGRSRTTHENALYLKELLAPKPYQRWALVTSAFHMPRAVATFRNQGFEVLPWPADFRTHGWTDAISFFRSPPEGLERVDLAFKEWVGLVGYRLSGRSRVLWPHP